MITGRSRRKDVIIALVLAFFAFWMMSDRAVPLLSFVDLGYHGVGRALSFAFPPTIQAASGSFFQIGVPFALGLYFFVRDEAATALCFGWAATDAFDVARHAADAPYGKLPAVFGMHDWSVLLGNMHVLARAPEIANAIRFAGWTMLVVGAVLLARPYIRRMATGHEVPA